jgi:hypothetical protein
MMIAAKENTEHNPVEVPGNAVKFRITNAEQQ